MKPLISVVLTTFNRPDRIPKALETVLNQSYQCFEILTTDGSNSPENERQVARYQRYDHRIKYIQVEPEAVDMFSMFGVQHSRNVGCKVAQGEWIAPLDDDDIWDMTKSEKQIKEALKDPEIGIVICYAKNIEPYGEFVEKPMLNPTYKDLLQSFNLAPTSTFLIRKDLLEKVGYWNEKLRGMHEYDIALKISKLGYKIITVPEILMYRYRSFNQERRYYYIKIAEVLDFWKYYGDDILPNLGYFGFIKNVAKTLVLFSLFMLGFIIKGKIWKVIYPLKQIYSQGEIK